MSDVNGAASAAAESISTPVSDASAAPAAAPAPARSEGSAPSAAPTRREAIDRAFAAVEGNQPASAPGTSTAPPGGPARDDAGRFAPKDGAAATPGAAKALDSTPAALAADPAAAKAIVAPERFTKAAKDAYSQVPEVVRTEVDRTINELTTGIQRYQQEFADLKPFHERARADGRTLSEALTLYTNMEQMIGKDPVRGFMEVCKNAGIDPVKIGEALAGQQSAGGDSPEVAALKMEVAQMRNQLGEFGQNIARTQTEAEVLAFASQNEHFEALADDIAEMLATGYAKDLPDAYAKAVRLNPDLVKAPASAQTDPQAANPANPAPAQTRKPNLQISGGSSPGSDPATRTPAGSPRSALDRAFSQVGIP